MMIDSWGKNRHSGPDISIVRVAGEKGGRDTEQQKLTD
jgi:hypothetical protein